MKKNVENKGKTLQVLFINQSTLTLSPFSFFLILFGFICVSLHLFYTRLLLCCCCVFARPSFFHPFFCYFCFKRVVIIKTSLLVFSSSFFFFLPKSEA